MIALTPGIGYVWLLVGFLVLAFFLLCPYLLAPTVVYTTLRISGDPDLEEMELDDPDLPQAVRRYMRPTLDDLREDGFDVVGAYYLGSLVPNVQSFLVLLANRTAQDLAMVAVTYADDWVGLGLIHGTNELRQRHVEFSTRFHDGTVIDTNNSEELSTFKPVPDHQVLSLPWVRDVWHLYEVHRAAVKRFGHKKTKEWRLGDDPERYLRRALVEEMSRQLDTGYLYRHKATGDFRPTLKGALLMGWKGLWPVTALRKAHRRRKGERFLREVGLLDGPDDRPGE